MIALFFLLNQTDHAEANRLINPQKITHSMGVENCPTWSPDGQYFAYTDADNEYYMADLSVIEILHIRDGKVFDLKIDDNLDFFPLWSRDSRVLSFISERAGTPDLWQVKISNHGKPQGQPQQLSFGLGLETMAFSRDHSKIAFSKETRSENLWRIPIPQKGTAAAKREQAKQLTFESSRNTGIDLSPDGKRIYFESNCSGNWDIWSMQLPDSEFRQVTSAPEDEGNLHLSPDGRTIAFVSARGGKREIWTMPSTGGPAKQTTDNQAPTFWPRWSPDGQTIAYQSSDANSNLNFWAVPARGGAARKITSAGFLFYPLWWPDGKSLLTPVRN